MKMNKKLAATLLTTTMLLGSAPVWVNSVYAGTDSTTSVDELYRLYNPGISKEEREYAIQLLKDTKIDTSKIEDGKIVVAFPKTTNDYYTILVWNDTKKDISHGGKTVTVDFNIKQGNYLSVIIAREEGTAEEQNYLWNPSTKTFKLESTQVDMLKQYEKVVKENEAYLKEKNEQPQQEQPQQEVPKEKPPINLHGLKDIEGHWAVAEISAAVEKGIVSGYLDKTFRPYNQITRAEFIRMLVSGLHVPASAEKTGFVDDNAALWAKPVIQAVVHAGIIKPDEYSDKKFEPNKVIRREEIAVFVVRAMGLTEKATNPSEVAKINSKITDLAKLDTDKVGYIKVANDIGVIAGKPDGSFDPYSTASRGEAVAMLLRAVEKNGNASLSGK